MYTSRLPSLATNQATVDRAFRIALGDVLTNVAPRRSGLLQEPRPVLLAGIDYDRPWTRDAAINTWNGAGLLLPHVTRSTLLSTLESVDGQLRIGGQYWDAIIWTIGAWSQYLYTGDLEFLAVALKAVRNSLGHLEDTEYNADLGLFRGPAVYGDGVSAYPATYARTGGSSLIQAWPAANPGDVAAAGYGIPMHALSTNCVYYRAYVLAEHMATALDQPAESTWSQKAEALKEAINDYFWSQEEGLYRYLVDPFGGSDHHEAMGHALALLFGVADEEQARAVLRNQHVSAAGIPCVWPTFARYASKKDNHVGRHSGTVWPHIQGLWADAAALHGDAERFSHELRQLALHACRDDQFVEIYHPDTGEVYGGIQETANDEHKYPYTVPGWHEENEPPRPGMAIFKSCSRQAWSATAFLRMVLGGLVGLRFAPKGITFAPLLPRDFERVTLNGIRYRGAVLDVVVEGPGSQVAESTVNGKSTDHPILPADSSGYHRIVLRMS